MLRVSLVTAPVQIPVSLDDIKDELRITGTQEDSVIVRDVKAAVAYAESYTETKIMTQTWDYYKDDFPVGIIRLPYPPLSSVTHIKYYDSSDVLQTLTVTTNYLVDSVSFPARIEYVNSWPTNYDKQNAVNVRFVCGYSDVANVPQGIKDAVILLAADFHTHRQDSIVVMGPVNMSLRAIRARDILDQYRLFNPVTL